MLNKDLYKVTYENGVEQTLELITELEYHEVKRKSESQLTERDEYILKGLKNGRIFTDNSPIFRSQYNDGLIILSHGNCKCKLEKI